MSSQGLLFACSKCFSRHPFEELSANQQLCKVKTSSFNGDSYFCKFVARYSNSIRK